jgi:hypothetical protein
MIIDPINGARVISLKFNDLELLTGPEVHVENYGSTLWTSPQSAWKWPPYPLLDAGPYQVAESLGRLRFTSLPDSASGLQFVKIFEPIPADTSFLIHYIIKNISDSARSVAPWEVTRVKAAGISFFNAAGSAILEKSNLPVTQTTELIVFEPESLDLQDARKLFADGYEAWLAYWNEQVLFLKEFPNLNPTQFAPGEAEIEIYIHRNKAYIELENQGEYRNLSPGDSLVWPVNWYLRPVETYNSVEDLAKEVNRILD